VQRCPVYLIAHTPDSECRDTLASSAKLAFAGNEWVSQRAKLGRPTTYLCILNSTNAEAYIVPRTACR
jgi:hypothetical protein